VRAAARFIDTVLTVIPFVVWGTLDHWVRTRGNHVDLSHLPLWWAAAWQGFAIVYETVLVATTGRTIGKVATRLRVERGDGTRPRWNQAALRIAVPGVAWLVPYFGGGLLAAVVYLTAAFHPLRQGLHDRAAGTLVVVAGPR
jgi:uncharacterized RDD family membrane protein YckC